MKCFWQMTGDRMMRLWRPEKIAKGELLWSADFPRPRAEAAVGTLEGSRFGPGSDDQHVRTSALSVRTM